MLSNCPVCSSDDIGIWGMSFITVKCTSCYHESKSFKDGTRRLRYNKAIANWNMGAKRNDENPLPPDNY